MNASRLLLLLLVASLNTHGQTLSSVHTRWSNSFVEWELYAYASDETAYDEEEGEVPEEVFLGELKLRWLPMRENWAEWEFSTPEEEGTIRMKWKDDPTQWELRTYRGAVVTMRTLWPNDFTEWRITNNNFDLTLRSRWKNQLNEWLVDDTARGTFRMYTYFENDPRDWAIDDKLHSSVSAPMRMALIFLVLFHSSPRF